MRGIKRRDFGVGPGTGYSSLPPAGVAELADATDSKSVLGETRCGFKSLLRHSFLPACSSLISRNLAGSSEV